METFPSSVFFNFPVKVESSFKTLVSDFESGKEQRRKRWAFPKRRFTIPYNAIDPDETDVLWKFYQERSGAYEAFWFIYPLRKKWYGEYLGVGNGTQVTFDLPSYQTESVYVYKDGVYSYWTFIDGGGQAGADRVEMGVTPEDGTILTADIDGQLRLPMRFEQDNLSEELFDYLLSRSQISLIEVKE